MTRRHRMIKKTIPVTKNKTKRAKSPIPMNTIEPYGKKNYARKIESLTRAYAIASNNLI